MVAWLNDWDRPIPETMRDHVNADDMGDMDDHDMDETDSDMPGMMTDEQLAELEAAPDQEFEDLWLEMMIEHHEGAIEMAQAEQKDGTFQAALDPAESIETSQQAEIDHRTDLLGS